MGVDVERFLQVAAEMIARLPRGGRQPGARARAPARRGLEAGPRQGLHRRDPDGLRALGGAAARGVDRQAGEGARAGSRRAARRARTASAARSRSSIPTTSAGEFYRWEFATAVAGHVLGINPFDQPDVQAAKDKTSEVLAAGEPDLVAARLARRAARPGAARATTSASRRSSTRPASSELAAARRAGARDGLRRHERPRPALPALDRPAAQGRAEHRPLRPGRRRHRRRAGDSRAATSASAA